MSDAPEGLFYTEEHEYLKKSDDDGVYFLGVTDYAQGELGDVVFVELPSAGDKFDRAETFGTIEAVKAVSDLYCPVQGEITGVNESLDENPSLVNSDPYGDGWMIKLRIADEGDLANLLDADAYLRLIGEA